jgi:CheY-like chemotaxis protein
VRVTPTGFELLDVVVVDDNDYIRELIVSLLMAMGIKQVRKSTDGSTAFEEIKRKPPDFVFADLEMRPVDGIEFAKMVRSDKDSPNQYLPIIMVSAHAERRRVELARDAGVTEFLAKPITPKGIYARITEVIYRPRPFIRTADYFGPDRRRRTDPDYKGPFRRKTDAQQEDVETVVLD